MTVDDVLITSQLRSRPRRPPDFKAENAALHALTRAASGSTKHFYQQVVITAKELCKCGSAGLSIVPDDGSGEVFRWEALAGEYKSFVGGTTPRNFSPCGTCVDRRKPLLYDRPNLFFTYFADVTPPILEELVIPIFSPARPPATLWVVSHDPARRFDREDVRVMKSLAALLALALAQRQLEIDLRTKAETLDRSDAFNRTILCTSPDCVKVLDKANRVVFINERGIKLIRLPDASAVLNRPWIDFWTGSNQKTARRALRAARKSGHANFQGFRATLRGKAKWWAVTINRMAGHGDRLLVVLRDITELKQTEVHLRDAKDEAAELARNLTLRVEKRNRELQESNKKLVRMTRKLVEAQEDERAFLAKELHDEMSQHLTGLKLLLEDLRAELGGNSPMQLQRAQDAVLTIMWQIRDLSFDLRRALPDHISLITALKWHFAKLERENGLIVRFTCPSRSGPDLSPEHSRTLLRLIQEALTNVLRHGQVKKATVRLMFNKKCLRLRIIDRGAGFDTREAEHGGKKIRNGSFGLSGMRDRVLLLGGLLTVNSRPGAGTTIDVEIPRADELI